MEISRKKEDNISFTLLTFFFFMKNVQCTAPQDRRRNETSKNTHKTDLQPVLWQNEMLYGIYFSLTCPDDVSSTVVHSGLCYVKSQFLLFSEQKSCWLGCPTCFFLSDHF